MKWMHSKPGDERVVAETNKIYKIGYLILSLGIMFDLVLQFTSVQFGETQASVTVRPVEVGVFLLAQIVCLVLMVRRGFMDDTRYAEAEVFPHKHYLLLALGAGAAASLLFCGLRMLQFPFWEFGVQAFFLVMGVFFLSMLLTCAAGVYALFYLSFRLARRRRNKIAAQYEDE